MKRDGSSVLSIHVQKIATGREEGRVRETKEGWTHPMGGTHTHTQVEEIFNQLAHLTCPHLCSHSRTSSMAQQKEKDARTDKKYYIFTAGWKLFTGTHVRVHETDSQDKEQGRQANGVLFCLGVIVLERTHSSSARETATPIQHSSHARGSILTREPLRVQVRRVRSDRVAPSSTISCTCVLVPVEVGVSACTRDVFCFFGPVTTSRSRTGAGDAVGRWVSDGY